VLEVPVVGHEVARLAVAAPPDDGVLEVHLAAQQDAADGVLAVLGHGAALEAGGAAVIDPARAVVCDGGVDEVGATLRVHGPWAVDIRVAGHGGAQDHERGVEPAAGDPPATALGPVVGNRAVDHPHRPIRVEQPPAPVVAARGSRRDIGSDLAGEEVDHPPLVPHTGAPVTAEQDVPPAGDGHAVEGDLG